MNLALRNITNEKLLNAYIKAKELNLDIEFIKYLEDEVRRRNLMEVASKKKE